MKHRELQYIKVAEKGNKQNREYRESRLAKEGIAPILIYLVSATELYSCLISSIVLNVTPKPAKVWDIMRSAEFSSSKLLGFVRRGSCTQYKGNPSREVGSAWELQTLKNFPLKPLYDFWKRVRMILPVIPLKLTLRFFPGLLASKKWRKTSTRG